MYFPDIYNVLSFSDYAFLQHANAGFLHSEQQFRNIIAWGLYFKLNPCLLVFAKFSFSPKPDARVRYDNYFVMYVSAGSKNHYGKPNKN